MTAPDDLTPMGEHDPAGAALLASLDVPGRVLVVTRGPRAPYQRSAPLQVLDVGVCGVSAAWARLSAANSENTVSMSAFAGSLNTLLAMAYAVRNRSYVLMAAPTSEAGALAAFSALSRLSNASVTSFTVMGCIHVVEITHYEHAAHAHEEQPAAHPHAPDAKEAGDTPRSALNVQVGGAHYKDMAIQPVEYIHRNGLGFCEGCAIKYLSRWRHKGGVQDLKKARHFIDLLIEMEDGAEP